MFKVAAWCCVDATGTVDIVLFTNFIRCQFMILASLYIIICILLLSDFS